MSFASSSTFRFRDLPGKQIGVPEPLVEPSLTLHPIGEICNKIYSELLCDIKPPPTTTEGVSALLFEYEPAHHAIDTAIFRTSTAIYREAYDVMIKTNRFVKITSVPGLPFTLLLKGLRVSIVASQPDTVNRFQGYVLAIHLGTSKPYSLRMTTGVCRGECWSRAP
jgi:hypothetical protein